MKSVRLPYPRILLAAMFLLLGCIVASGSALTLVRFVPPSNAFAEFADVFPGQPRSALIVRRFSCLTIAYNASRSAPDEACILLPASGVFAKVEVLVSQSRIRGITFTPREDTLRAGNLMLLWGEPTVTEGSHSVYLRWRHRGVSALVRDYHGQFLLQLPVRRVSIGETTALFGFQ